MIGRKLKMSQAWVAERVFPYTEIRLEESIDMSVFSPGDCVRVTGISKGRGFTGVVKRYHFKGGPATHGQSDRQRAPGAIGSTTTPGRVLRGKSMAGRSGNVKITLRTKVLEVDAQRMILKLIGPLPGSYGSEVRIMKI